jgi:hypothetical protein
MGKTKECAFCPVVAKLTGEHVWSDWMNAFLSSRRFVFEKKEISKPQKTLTWEMAGLDLKTNVVCGPCNSGWMSRIDNDEAKPAIGPLLIDLTVRRISIHRQISIAIFGFKTCVVGDYIGTDGTPVFTREERYAFHETLMIPSGIFMWIGALRGTNKGIFTTRHLKTEARSENDLGLYVFTFSAGHFVMQLACARWATGDPNRQFPILQQNPVWDSRMIPFYPPTGAIQWPPPECLTHNSLDELTNRWNTFTMTPPSS